MTGTQVYNSQIQSGGGTVASSLRKIDLGVSLSLDLAETTTFDQWVNIGRRLCAGSQVINWHIGDWWAFGDHQYGERAKIAAEGLFGREFQTLRNLATVSRSIEASRRRDVLTWSHHAEVASLPANEADALLERAERDGLSTRDLRREVLALRVMQGEARRARDVIDIRPEPAPEPDLTGTTMAEIAVELAESLGRERELTDRESAYLQKALQYLSRKNPRSLEAWKAEDELRLISMLQEGLRPPVIAPRLNRTVGALWRQINRMGGIGRILNPQQQTPVGRLGLSNG